MKKIKNACLRLYDQITYYSLKGNSNLTLGKGVKFLNNPYLKCSSTASIKIGDNTIINSRNDGYHVNMFSRCKIYADQHKAQIIIGKNCRIHGTCIHAFNSIIVGDNCLIAANTQIIDANGHAVSFNNPVERLTRKDVGKPIIIEDNVWIGTGCIILGGTHIKEGAIIGAVIFPTNSYDY